MKYKTPIETFTTTINNQTVTINRFASRSPKRTPSVKPKTITLRNGTSK